MRLRNTWHDDRDRNPENWPIHVLIVSTGLQIFGAGQCQEEKHGTKSRRKWRKLHLTLDADSGDSGENETAGVPSTNCRQLHGHPDAGT